MKSAEFDLVVFGASSFVGQILTRYLVEHTKEQSLPLNWAIAGRSESKLKSLLADIPGAEQLPVIVVDAKDETGLTQMCNRTRVIISTVGPYALFGESLIKACATTGTDYCDLTGEVQWIKSMIDRYETQAKNSGARIVHCCGFDSIPSDLGVVFLQKLAHQQFSQSCNTVKMRVKTIKGGASGGTIASMINAVREAYEDPSLRKALANPYSICPENHGYTVRQENVKTATFDTDFNRWSAPFVMAAINTRIVHRSNALASNAYGDDFRYDEAVLVGNGIKGRLAATTMVAGLGLFMIGAVIKPARWAMEKYILPKPGEGPTPEAQEKGFYDLRFVGKTADGNELRCKVTGDRDPGYGSTSKVLGQAALSLLFDVGKDEKEGGFWTPATIFDDRLFTRLTEHAGLVFERIE